MWWILACAGGLPPDSADPTGVDTAGAPTPTHEAHGADGLPSAAPRERVDPLVCPRAPTPDGGPVSWTVDGALFSGLTLSTEASGDTVFPGYTRAGQVWRCTTEPEGGSLATFTIVAFDPRLLDPWVQPTMWMDSGVLHYHGPLADAPSLLAYSGIDGWSARDAPADTSVKNYPEGELRYGVTHEMSREPGGWFLPLSIPATTRVVSAIFDASGPVDSNLGQEYTWDLIFPSIGPYLTWNDRAEPSSGMVINWATGQPGLGVVEFGPDVDHTAFQAGDTFDTLHHVSLVGLPADTSFVYRVLDSTGRASPWSTFSTLGDDADTFEFLVASDMQDDGKFEQRWPEMAAEMVADHPDARFLLAPGDLAAEDHPGHWWLFFEGGRGLFDHVPLVPAVGNHDTPSIASSADTRDYRRWFDLPTCAGDEDQYRLDVGRVRLFSLNTEVSEELGPGAVQYDWLATELAELAEGPDRPVDWAITFGHHPGYDIGKRFAVEAPIYRATTALFDGHIDVDIRAHEHIYQRFSPLRYPEEQVEKYGLGEGEGVAYVVTPACGFDHLDTALIDASMAGAEQVPAVAWPADAASLSDAPAENGYLVGSVTPDTLTLTFLGFGSSAEPHEALEFDSLVVQH